MEIVSTMGSGSLGREIDLEVLVNELEDYLDTSIEANFHTTAMVTIRLEEDGPAYTIYRTGTFQVRGSPTGELLNTAAERLQEILREMEVDLPEYEFEQATAVFMEDLDQSVDLEALVIALGLETTEYEPEQFPGLIYRPIQFDVTLLIFASGKVIIGGTSDRNEADAAIQHLREELSAIADV
jgi:transcription initiation factor TFIID TATA-box-binding protein